jgi:hypothetical protein
MAGRAEKGEEAEAFLAQLEEACGELLPEMEARLTGVEA